MSTFRDAQHRHQAVAAAAADEPVLAGDLWNAVAGLGAELPRNSFAEAVRDTAPSEHTTLLASEDVAAAYAFGLFWAALPGVADGDTPFAKREAAREQWAAFDKRAKQTGTLAEGFGWDLSSAWAHTREVKLAQGDMSKVEAIARLAGRMYAALRGAHAKKVRGVAGEVYAVEQGNDIARLLPAEQVLLAEPVLDVVGLERVATRRAAQYATRGVQKRSRGPLVIALDESSSMHARRNTWAKAAAVALARVASEEKRPVTVVHYSTSVAVQTLRPGDRAGLVTMIQHFLGGGTAIGLALNQAVDQVKALAQKGQPGADVVLVTDGVDGNVTAQAAAVDAAFAIQARLWTVAIECAIGADSPLRARASQYTRLDGEQLADGRSVTLIGDVA
jgi:Mg-chelatase subunit ChlD